MAADRNDVVFDGVMERVPLESSVKHRWEKRIAEKELSSWDGGNVINEGDTYYEYIINLKLYDVDIEMPENPVVTEKQYFKHVLQGRPGFKYFDKE